MRTTKNVKPKNPSNRELYTSHVPDAGTASEPQLKLGLTFPCGPYAPNAKMYERSNSANGNKNGSAISCLLKLLILYKKNPIGTYAKAQIKDASNQESSLEKTPNQPLSSMVQFSGAT